MAKKKKFDNKNIVINEEELSITKIDEINTLNRSPFFVIIFFGIFLVFIFALPNIENFIGKMQEKPDNTVVTNPTNEQESEEEEKKDTTYYTYSEDLSIILEEGITIHHFSTTNNTISFTITNQNDTKYYFSKHNYFLEIYSAENTLLERIILEKDGISKETSVSYTYTILENTATNISKLIFVEKTTDDYPNVVLEESEGNEEKLTCTNNLETLTYIFNNEELNSIKDVMEVSSDNSSFNELLTTWETLINSYETKSGVNATIYNAGTSFFATIVIDLQNAKLSDLDNSYYYELGTIPKIINFEMESRGFNCQ